MDVLKSKAMLKSLKWISMKVWKIESVQAQEINKVFSFIPEYRYAVLSRGMQLSGLTKSKLFSWPKWDLALECANKPS
jgi:hypothetical protein